jgi:hypothetical protein
MTKIESLEKSDTFMFANKLFTNGEYYQAAGEYQRFLFNYPDDYRTEISYFMQAYCCFRGKEYTQSNKILQSLLLKFPKSKYKNLVMNLSVANFYNNNWGSFDFDMIITNFEKKSFSSQQMLYIYGWNKLQHGEVQKCCEVMKMASKIDACKEYQTASKELLTLLSDNPPSQIKSYRKAVNLSSWLPGSGQWSLGNRIDGVKSFVVTSGVTYVAYEWLTSDFILGGLFMISNGTLRFYNGGKNNVAIQAINQNETYLKNNLNDKYYPWKVFENYLVNNVLNQEETNQ